MKGDKKTKRNMLAILITIYGKFVKAPWLLWDNGIRIQLFVYAYILMHQ